MAKRKIVLIITIFTNMLHIAFDSQRLFFLLLVKHNIIILVFNLTLIIQHK